MCPFDSLKPHLLICTTRTIYDDRRIANESYAHRETQAVRTLSDYVSCVMRGGYDLHLIILCRFCAIIGGVLTVGSLVDSFIFNTLDPAAIEEKR